MFKDNPRPVKFARTSLKDTESDVQPYLAYDLSDLDELRKQGRPISGPNIEAMYYDGSPDASFNLPLDQQRGVDINDMWNAVQDGKRKMSKAGVRKVDSSNSKT